LARVWVYADVYEYELPWVKVGQPAEVELSYEPGKTFYGEVTYTYPFLESKTRTVKVRMVFPNPEIKLKPGMYANVRIKPLVSRDALVVPSQALIRSGERNVVIVDLGEGRFMPREVRIGVQAEGVYEVLDGLREGEAIVTSAQFLIDSESNLNAALKTMTSESNGDGEEATPSEHKH
ncbi:MAG TPA: efflux RND transporter periplasmic adaptor subunit, partial [Candidatus Latescibacteria bacterium]|nr:efflux RND transporter periplasmic adaptor subunit [Candidatus Latescibacterota bacterium]